ncbi:uncharacterized protein LOC130642229 [Hydractinia symbiolongicarpus]|uniref:uncharacterized protein LOC130642229 n=1 Tax=Hydractinia symbiolongicarpus TaxID=13093 RepID=UPI00254B985B|nr:uncharacterized protein LOC130642229 [Hydractinia symbiolongicarpus]
MSPTRFEHLLSLIAPIITKCSLRGEAISPSEILCLTLRYLVTGDSQVSITCSYRVSPETCEALWTMLLREGYLKCPTTSAIDGKHVMMRAPASSGSTFFNYKKASEHISVSCM